MNHTNFRDRKELSQTSEFNTLGLIDDKIRPKPHGLGGRVGGREWGGSVKAGRRGGEKPRLQSQREPPDRNLGTPQGSRDSVMDME